MLPWAVAFLLLQLINTQDGGQNATSRFLTLRAMSEGFTFTIDDRTGASTDWSQTPDGHYYSNKAPGPMLLGFPVFFLADQPPRLWEKGYRDDHGMRHFPGYFQKTITCFVNQIFPLLLLVALILRWYGTLGISRPTQTYFLLAVFLGTTASLYFNNYSGHGFSAILQLGALYALLKGRYRWLGFFAGATLLSDYGFGVQIPALLAALALRLSADKKLWRPVGDICLGALLPAVLWVWYHVSAFGHPLLLPSRFQNPVYIDTAQETVNLWGIFRMPNFSVLWELLFGPSRGILYTQPWILFLLPLSLLAFLPAAATTADFSRDLPRLRRTCAVFCVLSLAALLFMNMSFGGWQGGGAAGPRYLSGIFLCFALWAGLELDRLPKVLQYFFWLLLGISLVFRSLVFGTTILADGGPLWQWYLFSEFAKPSNTAEFRFVIFWLILGAAWFWQRRLFKRTPALA